MDGEIAAAVSPRRCASGRASAFLTHCASTWTSRALRRAVTREAVVPATYGGRRQAGSGVPDARGYA